MRRMVHYRIENIETSPLETVTTDAQIQDALEAMFSTDSEQVGVLEDGTLRGIVSHRSISRMLLILARSDALDSALDRGVDLAMEDPTPMVTPGDDVFTLFEELAVSPYVLIDYDDEFHVLRDVGFHQYLEGELEAFIVIEEIERAIRELFREALGEDLPDRLTETFEPMELRTPSAVTDCSFAHYHVFISANWKTFDPYFEEDKAFVRELLDNVGEIRNALFHFRSDAEDKVVEREYIMFVKDFLSGETEEGLEGAPEPSES